MIKITREPNADSRTAKPGFNKEDLKKATKVHIEDVNKGMKFFSDMLMESSNLYNPKK